jgi:hypothetical protein
MSDTHGGPRRTDVIQHVGFEHAGVIADAARARVTKSACIRPAWMTCTGAG